MVALPDRGAVRSLSSEQDREAASIAIVVSLGTSCGNGFRICRVLLTELAVFLGGALPGTRVRSAGCATALGARGRVLSVFTIMAFNLGHNQSRMHGLVYP